MTRNLEAHSLEQIETYYRQGRISWEDMQAYLSAWNRSGKHYTYAYWQDGAIRQANYREDGTLPAWVPRV